jgi:hypothetical protein
VRRRHGFEVLAAAQGPVQRRMLVGPVARVVLVQQVEVAVGRDLARDEAQHGRRLLGQTRQHQARLRGDRDGGKDPGGDAGWAIVLSGPGAMHAVCLRRTGRSEWPLR